jgi:asparagine synthase (glutamine-hydrolysing)
MCGISALFLKSPESRHAPFRRSLDLVSHRGPDGRGIIWGQGGGQVLCGEQCEETFSWALGHVRLAILDTSCKGLQPMSAGNGSYWISYNGEVYNYVELKGDLEKAGHRFQTGTDTEIILAAYAQWGEKCLERFVGMFAFVLVDLVKRRVFCARDRFGVKPLYFRQSASGTFVFSEPKQLKAYPELSFRVNSQQLLDFLVDDVINHTPNESLFEGVTPLAPGHFLAWDLDNAFPDLGAVRPYWSLPCRIEPCTRQEAVERVRAAIIDAVRLRLRSDVPVGSCMSGGIDSSSLVGIAFRDFGARMHTFSACFEGYRFDEQRYMDEVNRYCGATAFKVFPSGDDFARELENVVYHQDEPFAGTSIYSQWCVMRAARENGIPVLLDGQGGDEALCGYRKYSFFYLKQLLQQFRYATAIRHAAMMFTRGDSQLFQLREGARYLPRFLRAGEQGIKKLLRPQAEQLYRTIWHTENRSNRSLKQFQEDDLLRWSLPVLLRYEDRNSMAHSVESRVPFVDHRFVELCMSLPDDLFFLEGKTKRLLTGAMGARLPEAVHNRRDKYGFTTPCDEWLCGELGRVLEQEIVNSAPLGAILDTQALRQEFAALRNGAASLGGEKLSGIGCLAVWMRLFNVEP